jgi:anti-sigma regulatory factor (Ser/Thr protein kinase)
MRLRVFPTVQAPSEARREVAALAPRIDETSLSDVRTVVGELIALSVSSGARKPIEISLDFTEGRVDGVVRDDGPGARALLRARSQLESALALRIVDGLVDDWDVNLDQEKIWFRMSVC